jgi:hypothetical protein
MKQENDLKNIEDQAPQHDNISVSRWIIQTIFTYVKNYHHKKVHKCTL